MSNGKLKIDFDDWDWIEEELVVDDDVVRVGDWVVAKFNSRYEKTKNLWVGQVVDIDNFMKDTYDIRRTDGDTSFWIVEKNYFIKGYKYRTINDVNENDYVIYMRRDYRVFHVDRNKIMLVSNKYEKLEVNGYDIDLLIRIDEEENLYYK